MENPGALMKIVKEDIGYELTYIVVDGEPWFKAKRVATLLGYANTAQAILAHVGEDDRNQLKELNHLPDRCSHTGNLDNVIFINVISLKRCPGLIGIIFCSFDRFPQGNVTPGN